MVQLPEEEPRAANFGDRRPPSPLGDIQPECWQAEYTRELLDVLQVLSLLVELEPRQAELLQKICDGRILLNEDLRAEGVFELPAKSTRATRKKTYSERPRKN